MALSMLKRVILPHEWVRRQWETMPLHRRQWPSGRNQATPSVIRRKYSFISEMYLRWHYLISRAAATAYGNGYPPIVPSKADGIISKIRVIINALAASRYSYGKLRLLAVNLMTARLASPLRIWYNFFDKTSHKYAGHIDIDASLWWCQ